MGLFRHHHSEKPRTMALFWLCTSYHAHRYTFQRYMLRSLLAQSFSIVNTPVILLFSKKWVPGLAAEDNIHNTQYSCTFFHLIPIIVHQGKLYYSYIVPYVRVLLWS